MFTDKEMDALTAQLETQNKERQRKQLRARVEALFQKIEADYNIDSAEVSEYKQKILSTIQELEQEKSNQHSENEQLKGEIIDALAVYFDKQQEEWKQKIAVVNDLFALLKQTQHDYEEGEKRNHEVYLKYVELATSANQTIEKYNDLCLALMTDFNKRVDELNRRASVS
jgi:hypothetical protein